MNFHLGTIYLNDRLRVVQRRRVVALSTDAHDVSVAGRIARLAIRFDCSLPEGRLSPERQGQHEDRDRDTRSGFRHFGLLSTQQLIRSVLDRADDPEITRHVRFSEVGVRHVEVSVLADIGSARIPNFEQAFVLLRLAQRKEWPPMDLPVE